MNEFKTVTGMKPSSPPRSHRFPVTLVMIVAALAATTSAWAQYSFRAPDEAQLKSMIRYFGSSKNEKGALLPSVTVKLDSDQSNYVFVTDEMGRFRAQLPLHATPEKTTVKCFREGFELVRVNVRPGPAAPSQTVQVDCVLRAK